MSHYCLLVDEVLASYLFILVVIILSNWFLRLNGFSLLLCEKFGITLQLQMPHLNPYVH